ncbi:hypothetical protein [Aureimonas sp. Leaf460]|uniref:hypothetical protein n=1 Tax=Aureimonas sp. Leaf460 TaxID=1736384 RepID=UPI000A82F6C2|nr:hypothetical protein [Aureimonas sp. Leaf460]
MSGASPTAFRRRFGALSSPSRRSGGGGAFRTHVSKEATTVVVLAPVVLIGGIVLFCWLIFSVAIYALPIMTGIAVALWTIE